MMRKVLLGALLTTMPCTVGAQTEDGAEAPAAAAAGFDEAVRLCRADGGKLWGISLCGPMLFVDPVTRRLFANEDGAEAPLKRVGDVFTGMLPPTIAIANTSIRWNGRDWAMVIWPLPSDPVDRGVLLMHESWHRIQADIGRPATNVDEDHLATVEGRIGMRLELRALAVALRTSGAARRVAVCDALLFRAWRQGLATDAAARENALELNEGLAEFSGRRLAGDGAMIAHMAKRLDQGDTVLAYARSFAYYTGPAYGMLLDDARPAWRGDLGDIPDLAALLAVAEHVALPTNLHASFVKRGARYGLPTLRVHEERAGRLRDEANARWTARLVNGPIVLVPLGNANIVFDPRQLSPLPPYGTIYPTLAVSSVWGRLKVERGALLKRDWSELSLARHALDSTSGHIQGDGWTLDLNPGWILTTGPDPKNLRVIQAAPPAKGS